MGCKGYRKCALALLGGAGLMAAAVGAVRAEPLAQATRRAAELTAQSITAIGGHIIVPTTPPPPPTTSGSQPPPPPPIDTGGTPPPPPPPTTGGTTPTPPPPTTQGGPGPSSAPEPATIVTGLMGLGIASAAGWYQRRKRR